MKYSITGRNQQTGENSTFVLEAQSEADAVAQATARGYFVDQVLFVPEPVTVTPLNYDGSNAGRTKAFAIVSLILGIICVSTSYVPICWLGCGLPLMVIGIIFGALGLSRPGRKMAIAGLILCISSLALTILSAALGFIIGTAGWHSILPP